VLRQCPQKVSLEFWERVISADDPFVVLRHASSPKEHEDGQTQEARHQNGHAALGRMLEPWAEPGSLCEKMLQPPSMRIECFPPENVALRAWVICVEGECPKRIVEDDCPLWQFFLSTAAVEDDQSSRDSSSFRPCTLVQSDWSLRHYVENFAPGGHWDSAVSGLLDEGLNVPVLNARPILNFFDPPLYGRR
jgi:hypothetical protein